MTHSHTELASLIEGFQQQSLTEAQWTHEAHLLTALHYLSNHDRHTATCLLRAGIITLNHALGGVNGPNNGYHETITLFWIAVIDQFVKKQAPNQTPAQLTDAFLQSRWSDSSLPFQYYSKERLMSTEAQAIWVEPDLKPFDF